MARYRGAQTRQQLLSFCSVGLLLWTLFCTGPASSRSHTNHSAGSQKAGPSKYTFYLHNTVYNPAVNNTDYFTSVYGPPPPGSFANPFNFGVVSTFEVPLTLGASNASSSAGIGQGFWVLDSQKGYVLFHAFTATIDDGTYHGTLTIMGQVVEAQDVRVLTVLGGTGDFLLARGVATNRLVDIDRTPPARWVLSFDLDLYYF